MSFDFLFESDVETRRDQLLQGDLLFRSAQLAVAISQAHRYYAEAVDYTHFMVLTQSCDLVRRHGRKVPKSRYLTICAVRPVQVVIERLLIRYSHKFHGKDERWFPLPVCTKEHEILVRQTLEKLLHNTEDGFFFMPRGSHAAITEDLCAFLPLSIALRATHYDTCVASKVAQLRPEFQAKVGWLAGNQYSRVGTVDFEEKVPDAEQVKQDYFDSLLYKKSIWLTGPQFKELSRRVDKWHKDNPGADLDMVAAAVLADDLPTTVSLVAKRVVDVLTVEGLLGRGAPEQQARTLLASDPVLTRLTR